MPESTPFQPLAMYHGEIPFEDQQPVMVISEHEEKYLRDRGYVDTHTINQRINRAQEADREKERLAAEKAEKEAAKRAREQEAERKRATEIADKEREARRAEEAAKAAEIRRQEFEASISHGLVLPLERQLSRLREFKSDCESKVSGDNSEAALKDLHRLNSEIERLQSRLTKVRSEAL